MPRMKRGMTIGEVEASRFVIEACPYDVGAKSTLSGTTEARNHIIERLPLKST